MLQTVTDRVQEQVQVPEGAWEREQKRIGMRQKSFGAGGKQKGLGFNWCVAPSCTQCPISETQSDRKETRGNQSRYSDWRSVLFCAPQVPSGTERNQSDSDQFQPIPIGTAQNPTGTTQNPTGSARYCSELVGITQFQVEI